MKDEFDVVITLTEKEAHSLMVIARDVKNENAELGRIARTIYFGLADIGIT